jgi:hypothetical protein
MDFVFLVESIGSSVEIDREMGLGTCRTATIFDD